MGLLRGFLKGRTNSYSSFLPGVLRPSVRPAVRYSPLHRIPLVDFSPLKTGMNVFDKSVASMQLAGQVFEATTTFGFCQIINHPIDYAIIKEAFYVSQEFFALPLDIKQTFYNRKRDGHKNSFHGYLRPQREIIDSFGLVECRENFDWKSGHGYYPNAAFEAALTDLQFHSRLLEKLILRLWAIGFGLEDIDYFVKLYRHWDNAKEFGGLDGIRLVYYPPLKEVKSKHLLEEISVRPHSSFISLVFQDNKGGLQVKTHGGKCVPVLPIPHSVVLNVGDLAEILTRGMFPATTCHVPTTPISEDQNEGRHSITYFSGPDESVVIHPLTLRQKGEESKLPNGEQEGDNNNEVSMGQAKTKTDE